MGRRAEVDELGAELLVHYHVFILDVPMQDTLRMQVTNGRHYLKRCYGLIQMFSGLEQSIVATTCLNK